MASRPLLRLLTVDEYERLGEVGILREDERVELVEGRIFQMTPIGSRHARCVRRLIRLLSERFADVAVVDAQNPVRLGSQSEVQPDLALLRLRSDDYAAGHPTPPDAYLLIEVADTTAAWDRRTKVPLYARSGVAEVWLIELGPEPAEATVTAYQDPSPSGYRVVRTLRRGERLAPAAFPDRELAVADLLV